METLVTSSPGPADYFVNPRITVPLKVHVRTSKNSFAVFYIVLFMVLLICARCDMPESYKFVVFDAIGRQCH